MKKEMLEDLLDEEAEQEEEIIIPRPEYDPVKKIASIFAKKKAATQLYDMLGHSTLKPALIGYYLLDGSMAHDYVMRAKDEEALPKFLLTDSVNEIFGRKEYDMSMPLPLLVAKVSLNVYNDAFGTLFSTVYLKGMPKAKKKKEKRLVEVPEEYQHPVKQFKGVRMEAMIAAEAFYPYVRGVERLRFARDVKDLRHIAATKVYHGFVKNEETKNSIEHYLEKSSCDLKKVFLYSILALHQDFFLEIGKEENKEE
ncbi:MAG: hypothetical protein ABIB71_06225 [Candidatus Woesearchaeota archaeon]